MIAQLKANQSHFEASNLHLVDTDSRAYLKHIGAKQQFDIVFIDPPFASSLHQEISLQLTDNKWLSPDALIYTELPISAPGLARQNWQLLKDKTAGEVRYCLYQYIEL